VFHTKVSLVPFPTILGEGEGISILWNVMLLRVQDF
jgi:hypothetical protein